MNASLKFREHHSLQSLNTLRLSSVARYYAEINTLDELTLAIKFAKRQQLPLIPLGGGSNVVLGETLDAVVVRINLAGRQVVRREDGVVHVRAAAGENWHDLVQWTLAHGAYGLENLSLIPGTVGAAPIQNIGAYGVELKDYFVALEAINVGNCEVEHFDRKACGFGYRDSVFKNAKLDQYIITAVTLVLDATLKPQLEYGRLAARVAQRVGGQTPSAFDISQAVCDMRKEKLPDSQLMGNAGSFFKNPEVSAAILARLQARYPDIVAYPVGNKWKLAAGWLIDKAGLRGERDGRVGTYSNQALVLVNYGGANGENVVAFADKIQRQVRDRFGVLLEREPRLYR